MNYSGIFLLIAALAFPLWCAIAYNRFVAMRNRCVNARSQVDVELKMRHDVVPRLAELVRGYAAHEKRTLESLALTRAAAVRADSIHERIASENALSSSISSLFAVAEGYPELRADDNFLRLQDELAALEDRIRFSRQFYNDTVMRYNTLINLFPNSLAAGMLRFREEPFFEFESGIRGETARPDERPPR
ncbi:MAG: LemA family protein [Candidatus Krumholzibacteria bacterium]|nr:LemA family protein [Candidatus Krumholzibacteria bacterium]